MLLILPWMDSNLVAPTSSAASSKFFMQDSWIMPYKVFEEGRKQIKASWPLTTWDSAWDSNFANVGNGQVETSCWVCYGSYSGQAWMNLMSQKIVIIPQKNKAIWRDALLRTNCIQLDLNKLQQIVVCCRASTKKKKEKKAHLSYWASNNLSPFKDYLFKSFPRPTYKHETEMVKDKFFLCIIQLTASAVQSMCWWSCSYLERYTCFQW